MDIKPYMHFGKVLDNKLIDGLNKIFDDGEKTRMSQWHNLININLIPSLNRKDPTVADTLSEIELLVYDLYGKKERPTLKKTFMVEYYQGSFVHPHLDNKFGSSFITLIDQSKKLDGGEVLVYQPINTKEIKDRFYPAESRDGNNCKEVLCPIIIPMKVGETIAYRSSVKHAVTEIREGRRRVLVTWFY